MKPEFITIIIITIFIIIIIPGGGGFPGNSWRGCTTWSWDLVLPGLLHFSKNYPNSGVLSMLHSDWLSYY